MPASGTIVVTGATGHLGRLVVEELLARGVAPERIVATGRNVEKLADLADRGIQVRPLDYSHPASIRTAVDGASRVLLVSGNEFGQRAQQHANVAKAAADAGAELLVYTSAPYAATTPMKLAAEHAATEAAIQEIGVPFTFLRNSWYFENYTAQLGTYLEHGAVVGAASDGLISGATRADYAAAAAGVLTTDGHQGKIYELGGDEAFTLTDLAQEISKQSGKDVAYRNLPVAEFRQFLTSAAGMPEPIADVMADVDANIAEGRLHSPSRDLSRLAGRPTTPLSDAVAAALSSAG